MSKFLRTIDNIDDCEQKVIYKIDYCTHCPLMEFHKKECISTCRTFMGKDGNIIDPFIVNYDPDNGEVFEDIKIPKWCSLADNINQLDFDTKTYVVIDEKILITDGINDMDLPIMIYYNKTGTFVRDIYYKQTNENLENSKLDIIEMLPALITNNVFSSNCDTDIDKAYEEAYLLYDNYHDEQFTPTKNKYGICSLCGEEDETVNRNTNHGMCDSCWEVSYNDDIKKKQSFINNFRIKRGESFKLINFNTSILKIDNLKVLITI